MDKVGRDYALESLRARHPDWTFHDDACPECGDVLVKFRDGGRWVCMDRGCELSAG